MTRYLKNTLWALFLAFLIFYVITKPEAAADAVRHIFGAFDAIGRFFTRLAG